MSRRIWGTPDFPATSADLAAALAAGASEIVQLPSGALVAGYQEIPDPVPASCSRAQGLLALLNAGLLTSIQNYIATLPQAEQIAFAAYDPWHRQSPTLIAIGAGAGLSPDQIDALFASASRIGL